MDDALVLKIIDIENQAQQLIKSARQSESDFHKNIAEEAERLKSDIENKAIAKNEALKENELQNAEKVCNEIAEETRIKTDKLNEKYNKNKDIWVDRIISNIIG